VRDYHDRQGRRDRWARDASGISLVRQAVEPQPVRFAAEPEPIEIDLARSALIVVDMQNDFLDAEGWFAAVRDAEVAPLGGIIPRSTSCPGFSGLPAPR
jgi:hypothetical protein